MIRPARPSDIPQIAALLQETLNPVLACYLTYSQHGIGAFLATYVEQADLVSDRMLLVAAQGSRVNGFAEFRLSGADNAHLSYICVHPDARGKGLASTLVRHPATLGARQIDLFVFADNAPALALYAKLGFAQDSEMGWFVRALPPADGSGTLIVRNLPVATASFDRFGFCEMQAGFGGRDIRVGRIGDSVLRCFSQKDFADDALLARLAAAFPSAREALFIGAVEPGAQRPAHLSLNLKAVF